jgi:hypothetical protein
MPSLQEILRDPNYINANEATKRAIFERHAPLDQNYTGANDATQAAIRQRFGIGQMEMPSAPAQPEQGALVSGFKSYVPSLQETYGGLKTLLGVGAERVIGEGAISKGLIESGAASMAEAEKARAPLMTKERGSFTDALDKGVGSVLTEWLPFQAGAGAAQVLEALALVGAGGLAGTATAPGPGTIVGAGTGLVARELAKRGVKEAAEKILKERGEDAAKVYFEKAAKDVALEIGKKRGQTAALAGQAAFYGTGQTTSRAVEEAEKLGGTATDIELARVLPASAVATVAEFLGDKIALGALKGIKPGEPGKFVAADLAKNILLNIGLTGTKEVPVEVIQSAAERFGAKLSLTDAQALKEYIDSTAASYGMAVGPGGAGGVRQTMAERAKKPEAPALKTPPVAPPVAPPPVAPEATPEQVLQRVEEVTGVNRAAPPSAEESVLGRLYKLDDAEAQAAREELTQQRLQRQQEQVDAEAERIAELNRRQGMPSPDRPKLEIEERPSIAEAPPVLAPREDLLAKQAEVDQRRLEAGLPTGEASTTPGVQPTPEVVEEPKPVPKIVDNRPLATRAAKNRLLVMRNMLQNQGGDPESLTIVPHPTAEGKFAIQSLDVPTKLTPDLPRTAITRPETPTIIDPVNAYVEIQRRTNTPAARRFVQEYEAGRITREDVERAIEQEQKAGQPQPLTYTATGAPGIVAPEVSKPRGEREVPKLGEAQPKVEKPEEPPIEEPPGEEPPTPKATLPQTLEEFETRMPLVFDKAEVREANNDGNFSKLAKALQLSPNPAIRRIGQLGAGISSKITLRKPGRLGAGVAGVYRYADDSIQMIPSYAGDEHVNAHETLHALISKAQRFPTDRQKPVVQQIEKLFEHVKKELKKKGITAKEAYGLTNPREFTAEAMTNPKFQYELMQIPYPGKKSAWTQFVRLVADLLGIQNTNALTEVMNLVDRLATQKQPRKTVTDKGLTDEMAAVPEDKPTVAAKVTAAAQKALQKQPMPEKGLGHVSPELTNLAQPIFFPQNKTILDRIDSMKDRFWQRLAQGTADQFRTIKEYSPVGYMQARMSKSIDGSLEGLLFHGQVVDDGGALNIKKNTKGMMEILKPIGNELDSYLMWVALNRESRLPEPKRSKIPNMDKLVARRAEFAAGELNGKPRVEVYQDILKQMNQLNKSVLDIALKKGLIDQEGYDNFSNDIYYIPFYKKMEEDGTVEGAKTASGLTSQDFSKELKGSEAPFGDLMENIVRNWSHILSASMKNAAAKTTIDDAMELQAAEPNLKAGYEWKDGKVYSTKNDKPIAAKFDEDGKQLYAEGVLRPDLTTGGTGMAKIMVDGQPMYFKITDELLMESISSIGYMGPKSKFLDVMRDFKNMLQFGVTASPIFKVNNLIRDSVSALAVSDLKKSPVYNVMTGISLSKKDSPTYISALAGGAIFNFGSAYEGDQAKLIKRLLDQGVDGETILDSPDKIKKALKKTWDAYQELGNRSEAANRLSLYQQMRDKGMSHLEASFMARDLLDFSMQGSWGTFRFLTQVVPFMNARIQGLYKLGRDGINPTVRLLYNATTGKEIDANDKIRAAQFATVSSAVMLASALLYLTFKDDEDFKKRDAWDRDNFWWFKIPSLDIAFRIPKPFEIGALGTLTERTLEQILDQGAEGKQFGDSLTRALWDTFALNPTPQIFKPLVDLYSNKDSFSGAPIESAGLERLSKQERMTDQTSPLAIALGGLTTLFPEKFEMSPVQVDYAIKGYFGWLGAMASLSSTYAVMPFKEGEYPDARWLDRASLGLVRDLPAPQSAYVTAFYNSSKEISQAYADMRHYREMGDAEKVQELLEEKGDKIALAKFYDKTAKNIANVRKQIQLITNDPNMDGAEKKEAIERMKLIMSDLAKQAEEVRKSMKQ